MRRWLAVAIVCALAVVACTSNGDDDGRTRASGPTASTPPSATTSASPAADATPSPPSPRSPSVLDAAVVEAPAGGSFLVRGRYPRVESSCVRPSQPVLTGRYPGTMRVEPDGEGTLRLTVSIPFEDYLRGIAEVPASWPMAALEAQAIAARSYALASTGWTGEGDTLEEPICSTAACQVYRGIPPSRADARRWFKAVRRTRGLVLVHEGRPATTFYFSTSNGQTYGNEDVFGGEPLPYLRPVTEGDDGASGLSHWSASIRYDDLARFLAAAGEWDRGRISSVGLDGGDVVVNHAVRMSVATFRDAVNMWASCLEPDRYPQDSMPTTLPSIWFTLSSGRRAVAVEGRGWGHGVGMVQWGAYGKAQRGLSASDILAAYYGGYRPEPFPEPGVIDVEVADGLRSITILPSFAPVVVGGVEVDGRFTLFPADGGVGVR